MDPRQIQLQKWLSTVLDTPSLALTPITGDASFRRYFRLQHQNMDYIAMDSPPEKEPCQPFVNIAKKFLALNLRVPQIFAEDIQHGFLLISDLGDQLYIDALNNHNADQLYRHAIDQLITIQSCQNIPNHTLESFMTTELQQELAYFTKWFLEAYLALSLTQTQNQILEKTYATLLKNALEQPQYCIHRDYHSRNLMVLPNNEVGILDFQDAMIGPITYDLVSLIRDCYVDWPQTQIIKWMNYYREKALSHALLSTTDAGLFTRWFDLTGIQRHLKATFIFARKSLRDQNDSYLQYIPRTLNYVKQIAQNYCDLSEFHDLLNQIILPTFEEKSH